MKAAVWYDKKEIRVENWDTKEILPNEVKVKVAWAGICGSDLHEYLEGPITIPVDTPDPLTNQKAPLVLGHEYSGLIEEVGLDITHLKKGDRVIVNPLLTYGEKSSEYDVYDGFNFIGLGRDGGFAEYSVVPAKNIYKLPDSLSLEEGALVEPTAVAVQALKEANLQAGQTVAILGAGPIGLLTVIAAKAAGASKIIVFDISEPRLEKAKKIGATHVINSSVNDPIKIYKEIESSGFDVVLEVAGVEATLNQAINITRVRGTMVIVSLFPKPVLFNPMDLTVSGVKITSSLAYEPDVFQKTIDLMASSLIDVKEVITRRIELERIVEDGFNVLIKDKTQAKILVKLSGEN